MIVVSDSSPLIALLAVDRVELFKRLFGTILIPPAVHDEVFSSQPGRSVVLPDFIRVGSSPSATSVSFLEMNLHLGESQAIALALEQGIDKIILDDKQARQSACRLGLRVIGTLGLLILAKEKGLITDVRSLIMQMMDRINFRLAPSFSTEC